MNYHDFKKYFTSNIDVVKLHRDIMMLNEYAKNDQDPLH